MAARLGFIVAVLMVPSMLYGDCGCQAARPCVAETIRQEVTDEEESWAFKPVATTEFSFVTHNGVYDDGSSLRFLLTPLLLLAGTILLMPLRQKPLIRLQLSEVFDDAKADQQMPLKFSARAADLAQMLETGRRYKSLSLPLRPAPPRFLFPHLGLPR